MSQSDDALTRAVKESLAKSKTLDADSIKVETKEGIVTLSGTAKSALEKNAAAERAMAIKGATVKNQIVVRP